MKKLKTVYTGNSGCFRWYKVLPFCANLVQICSISIGKIRNPVSENRVRPIVLWCFENFDFQKNSKMGQFSRNIIENQTPDRHKMIHVQMDSRLTEALLDENPVYFQIYTVGRTFW